MKVVYDTNIYISWIRKRKFTELMLGVDTQKYLSSIVMMELWAGAKAKQSKRIVEKLQKPYIETNRCLMPQRSDFITAGNILSSLPEKYKNKAHSAGFLNDVFIGLSALSIGAELFTENKDDFTIIKSYLNGLKVIFV